jgi:hypothetical protein
VGLTPTFLTPLARTRDDDVEPDSQRSKKKQQKTPRQKVSARKRRTIKKTSSPSKTTSWNAPGSSQKDADAQPETSSAVWRVPTPERKAKEKKIIRKPAAPKRVRLQDLEQPVIEELRESEILVVLQALATKSPEAQEMLNDVLRRIVELQNFDIFRQI